MKLLNVQPNAPFTEQVTAAISGKPFVIIAGVRQNHPLVEKFVTPRFGTFIDKSI